MAQDDDPRRVGAIVALVQQAPGRGRDAQHVEGVGRHPRAREPLGDAVAGQARTPIGVRGETRQRARPAPVVDELRQRERRARIVGAHRRDPHQPLGRRERQRPDEHGVDDREHGGRRANRERQRRDDGQRETGLAEMLTERDAEIGQHSVRPLWSGFKTEGGIRLQPDVAGFETTCPFMDPRPPVTPDLAVTSYGRKARRFGTRIRRNPPSCRV